VGGMASEPVRRSDPRLRYWLPLAYLLLAAVTFWQFLETNPDGLANVGLVIMVLPVTLAGLLIKWLFGIPEFPLIPDWVGYYWDHAVFFIPSALLVAVLLWRFGLAIDRAVRVRQS
jgi:hypothetical protein